MSPRPPDSRRRRRALALLALLVAAAFVLARPARLHLRAAGLLLRFADANAHGVVADFDRRAVDEELTAVPVDGGEVRARIYTPQGVAARAGVVIVHGVHRLGIDEPRLSRFARAIASTGVVVLTPEVKEIAGYTVAPESITTIGAAAKALRARLGGAKVGVMGMSFAGGLALLAAADPAFADDIGFVVAVGAHHDLSRVARFFATNQVERPDGTTEAMTAHDYGMLVLVHSRVDAFVPAADAPAAREALGLWLRDDREAARARAATLGPEARKVVEALFDHRLAEIAPTFSAEVARESEVMARVSPRGHLGALRARVFLLHGAGDTVIPAAETLWLAKEIPPEKLDAALVSPAIVHVEVSGDPWFHEKWALIHFMAGVIRATEAPIQ